MRAASAVASESSALTTLQLFPNFEGFSGTETEKASRFVSVAVPVGVELVQELVAALGFVGLADALGHGPEPVEGAQEAAVGGMAPPHVAAAPPARRPQCIEAAVV